MDQVGIRSLWDIICLDDSTEGRHLIKIPFFVSDFSLDNHKIIVIWLNCVLLAYITTMDIPLTRYTVSEP